jgi:hypothetical protein
MGIAEDEKINAVEESGEQETPDGEVADKREFVTWDPLSLYFYFDVSLPKKSTFSSLPHGGERTNHASATLRSQ